MSLWFPAAALLRNFVHFCYMWKGCFGVPYARRAHWGCWMWDCRTQRAPPTVPGCIIIRILLAVSGKCFNSFMNARRRSQQGFFVGRQPVPSCAFPVLSPVTIVESLRGWSRWWIWHQGLSLVICKTEADVILLAHELGFVCLCSLQRGLLFWWILVDFYKHVKIIYIGTGAVDHWFHWQLPSPPSHTLITTSQKKNPNHWSVWHENNSLNRY